MLHRAYIVVFIKLMAVPALAQVSMKAPSCIRITSSTESEATIQFEPHGGDAFEAERYYNSRWTKYKASIITSGQQHSLTVPLSKSLMNIVRVCAISGTNRVCSSEGVYAKR